MMLCPSKLQQMDINQHPYITCRTLRADENTSTGGCSARRRGTGSQRFWRGAVGGRPGHDQAPRDSVADPGQSVQSNRRLLPPGHTDTAHAAEAQGDARHAGLK